MSHTQETRHSYVIGDCDFLKDQLPASYPGPQLAFHPQGGCKGILDWAGDVKFGHNAAILTFMFAETGGINFSAPICEECGNDMLWTKHKGKEGNITPGWQCQKGGKHKTKAWWWNSPFFQFLKHGSFAKKLGTFVQFLVFYFNPSTTIKASAEFGGLKGPTGYKWGLIIRKLCGKSRIFFKIKLGDNGSVIEFDGTYMGRKWKYHRGKVPEKWNETCWFRMIERQWTSKGRHRRLTFMVKREKAKYCVPSLEEHCVHGSQLMADGCTFGKNQELNEIFKVDQCVHAHGEYVKIGTEHMDAHHKVHDNTAEASFQYDKMVKIRSFGMGQRCVSNVMMKTWLWESDWRNNFTTMETTDCVQTFFEHVALLYSPWY